MTLFRDEYSKDIAIPCISELETYTIAVFGMAAGDIATAIGDGGGIGAVSPDRPPA